MKNEAQCVHGDSVWFLPGYTREKGGIIADEAQICSHHVVQQGPTVDRIITSISRLSVELDSTIHNEKKSSCHRETNCSRQLLMG